VPTDGELVPQNCQIQKEEGTTNLTNPTNEEKKMNHGIHGNWTSSVLIR